MADLIGIDLVGVTRSTREFKNENSLPIVKFDPLRVS